MKVRREKRSRVRDMNDGPEIRLWSEWLDIYEGVIEVCPHIQIRGDEREDDGSEYIEHMTLYCKVCKKEFHYSILVN